MWKSKGREQLGNFGKKIKGMMERKGTSAYRISELCIAEGAEVM